MALKTASDAGNRAEAFCLELYGLMREAIDFEDRNFGRAEDFTDKVERVIDGTWKAVQVANDRDDALIDAIRADLHGERGRACAAEAVQPTYGLTQL